MLWPLLKSSFDNAVISSKTLNVDFHNGKDELVIAPFDGIVSVLAGQGVAVVHVLSPEKSYTVMMSNMVPLGALKDNQVVKEGDIIGSTTSADLHWSAQRQEGKNQFTMNPIELGGLLGGLFFKDPPSSDLAVFGKPEEKRNFFDKAGDALVTGLTFVAGAGFGWLAGKGSK